MGSRFILFAVALTQLRRRFRSFVFPIFGMENGVIQRSHLSPGCISMVRLIFHPMVGDCILDQNGRRNRIRAAETGIFGL